VEQDKLMKVYEALQVSKGTSTFHTKQIWAIRLREVGSTFSHIMITFKNNWIPTTRSELQWDKFLHVYTKKDSIWEKERLKVELTKKNNGMSSRK